MLPLLTIELKMIFPINARRSEQEGYIAVDHGKPITARSPGRLKQLNTNTGLFIGKWHSFLKHSSCLGTGESWVVCLLEIILEKQLF